MADKISEWLEANSPIDPMLLIPFVLVLFFPLFYVRDVKRWRQLQLREKSRVIGSALVIIVLLIIGIEMSLRK